MIAPYRAAVVELGSRLDTLQAETRDNPAQLENVVRIRRGVPAMIAWPTIWMMASAQIVPIRCETGLKGWPVR